jgi:O-antigen/teichoic acid export membrane protein
MGLVFVPVYIHYLGMEAWGLVGFLVMMQGWMTLLDLGLTPTLNREMARYQAGARTLQSTRDLLRSLEIIYGAIAVLVIAIIWFAAPLIASKWLNANALSTASVARSISVMGLVLAARMAELVYRGAIQGLQRQVWLNVALGALATLRWAAVVGILAWVSPTIEAFFLWQGLISLLTVAVLARQTYHWLPTTGRAARFDIVALMEIRRFAAGMVATTFLGLLLTQIDRLLLSKIVSLEEFGIYTLAAAAAGALNILVAPMAASTQPHLTELVAKGEHDALRETYHRACQILAAILVPAALVMSAFAYPLLLLWTGNESIAARAAPALTILALGSLCNGFASLPYVVQLAHGRPGLSVKVNFISALILVPAIAWSVPRYGTIAAAWVWFALNAGYVFISVPYMHRSLLRGELWRWYRYAVIGPVVIGTAVVMTVRHFADVPSDRISIAVFLALTGLLVAAFVSASIPAFRPHLRHRFLAFVK